MNAESANLEKALKQSIDLAQAARETLRQLTEVWCQAQLHNEKVASLKSQMR